MAVNLSSRLLIRSEPKADESFIGYVVRLTEQNGYGSPLWILKMAKLMRGEPRYSFNFALSDERFTLLAQLTGISTSRLASIAHPPSDDKLDHYLFFGNTVPRHCIRLSYPKICPECLSESPYCRRIWEFSLVTTCPTHKCLLVDECLGCGKRITWIRRSVCACSCNFDWRESPPIFLGASELTLTRHVHELCGLPVGKTDTRDKITQTPVQELSLDNLILALLFIAGQHKGSSITTGRNLVPRGRNRDFHALLIEAFAVFKDWPKNYYKFLDWVREKQASGSSERQRQKSVLYKEFGKFYLDLFNILSEGQFGFIKEAFIKYSIERWDSFYTLPLGTKNGSTPSPKRMYVSKNDARRLLEIYEGQMTQLIKGGKLKSFIQSKGKRRLIFVEILGVAKQMRIKGLL